MLPWPLVLVPYNLDQTPVMCGNCALMVKRETIGDWLSGLDLRRLSLREMHNRGFVSTTSPEATQAASAVHPGVYGAGLVSILVSITKTTPTYSRCLETRSRRGFPPLPLT